MVKPNPPRFPLYKGGSFLPLKKGGQEGFNQGFFCLRSGPFEGPANIKPPALPEVR